MCVCVCEIVMDNLVPAIYLESDFVEGFRGHISCMKAWLDRHKNDLETPFADGETAIARIQHRSPWRNDLIPLFIAAGANVNVQLIYQSAFSGSTVVHLHQEGAPTHSSPFRWRNELISLYIDPGVNANAYLVFHEVPEDVSASLLHDAAMLTDESVITLLLNAGARPDVVYSYGLEESLLPWQVARKPTIRCLLKGAIKTLPLLDLCADRICSTLRMQGDNRAKEILRSGIPFLPTDCLLHLVKYNQRRGYHTPSFVEDLIASRQ